MSEDVTLTIRECADRSDQELFQIFISRIQAWQYFMDEIGANILSPESEIGLFGELTILIKLIELGVTSGSALSAWQGPLNGLHDFRIKDGGIEVKTTASADGFTAKIGSLDQLDCSVVTPLFLAGVRISALPDGETLTSLVNSVRDIFRTSPSDLYLLNCRLLQVGFLDAFANKYIRKYRMSSVTGCRVDNAFPCLTRNKVPSEIRSLQYVLDLSMLADRGIGLEVVLKELRDK